MEKKFKKNDQGFICDFCGTNVKKLNYTSRNHCPECLVSLHLDINPGDRKSECKGFMFPVDAEQSSKKGIVLTYKCNKCGKVGKNKAAKDDNLDSIISVMNKTYKQYIKEQKIKLLSNLK